MADAKGPKPGAQEGSKPGGMDELDPSILEAVGAANAELKSVASPKDELDPSILDAVGAANAELKSVASTKDQLDPSILEAVGAANAELKTAAKAMGATQPASETLDASSIDDLLKQASFEDPQHASEQVAADVEVEKVLANAGVAGRGGGGGGAPPMPTAPKFDLPSFQGAAGDGPLSSIDLLRDVELNVKIELGRSRMLVEDVLKLGEGAVVELDKLAGDPVDVFVNDRLVARGEVLVLNDNFCVRVNEIVAGFKDDAL